MEDLGEKEEDTTLGLVAKHFTDTNKAHRNQFQVGFFSSSKQSKRILLAAGKLFVGTYSSDWHFFCFRNDLAKKNSYSKEMQYI